MRAAATATAAVKARVRPEQRLSAAAAQRAQAIARRTALLAACHAEEEALAVAVEGCRAADAELAVQAARLASHHTTRDSSTTSRSANDSTGASYYYGGGGGAPARAWLQLAAQLPLDPCTDVLAVLDGVADGAAATSSTTTSQSTPSSVGRSTRVLSTSPSAPSLSTRRDGGEGEGSSGISTAADGEASFVAAVATRARLCAVYGSELVRMGVQRPASTSQHYAAATAPGAVTARTALIGVAPGYASPSQLLSLPYKQQPQEVVVSQPHQSRSSGDGDAAADRRSSSAESAEGHYAPASPPAPLPASTLPLSAPPLPRYMMGTVSSSLARGRSAATAAAATSGSAMTAAADAAAADDFIMGLLGGSSGGGGGGGGGAGARWSRRG